MGSFGTTSSMQRRFRENRDAAKYSASSHKKGTAASTAHRDDIFIENGDCPEEVMTAIQLDLRQERRKSIKRRLWLAAILVVLICFSYFRFVEPILFN